MRPSAPRRRLRSCSSGMSQGSSPSPRWARTLSRKGRSPPLTATRTRSAPWASVASSSAGVGASARATATAKRRRFFMADFVAGNGPWPDYGPVAAPRANSEQPREQGGDAEKGKKTGDVGDRGEDDGRCLGQVLPEAHQGDGHPRPGE